MYRSKRVAIYVEQCNAGIISCDDAGNIYKNDELLKTKPDKDGYLNVCIMSVYIPSHQIIAYIKYGDAAIQSGIVARHLNDIKTDNRWENIAIGTPLDNSRDIPPGKLSAAAKKAWNLLSPEQKKQRALSAAAGVSKENRTIRAKRANAALTPEMRKAAAKKIAITRGFRILTDEQKLQVAELYKSGQYTQQELADLYNVGQHYISNCVVAAGASKAINGVRNIDIALSHVTSETRRKIHIARGANILSSEKQQEVKELYAVGGISHVKLAKQFNCSATQIRRIVIGVYDQ